MNIIKLKGCKPTGIRKNGIDISCSIETNNSTILILSDNDIMSDNCKEFTGYSFPLILIPKRYNNTIFFTPFWSKNFMCLPENYMISYY